MRSATSYDSDLIIEEVLGLEDDFGRKGSTSRSDAEPSSGAATSPDKEATTEATTSANVEVKLDK